ncbi:hypothetical protein [Sphingobacterium mizutaii]|uniref:hypothetical protein n=1 Tax=Sphingobacterium mizutaii TaxID=1010 RepID=UPI0016240C11|nr:hypothetical protein [Sphingobacterium mizutaii]
MQNNISPLLGVGLLIGQIFYKDITPSKVPNLYKHPFFQRKSFSLRLISNGGKMERMPLPSAMGLALECFFMIIPSKGVIMKKIFPTSRHSIHV